MKLNKKKLLLVMAIILETVLVKLFMYKVFPPKFFYDSNGIVKQLGQINDLDIARKFTITFFTKINIFHFTTVQQWGWGITIIFTTILIKKIFNYEKYNIIQTFFILMSVILLNIYVFNISKDAIQFLIFLILYKILNSKKSNNFKVVCSFLLFLFEALFFRVYYLIMGLLILTIYIIYKLFLENKKIEKKGIIKIIMIGFALFFLQIYILQKISYENYNSIMFARSSVNISRLNGLDANTIILEFFGNNNSFLTFIMNYFTVFIRLLFPVELIVKGLKYIPFIIYQLLITFNLLKFKKQISKENVVWLIVSISFFMTSAIFEPDFGSFIRHESAMIFILLHLFVIKKEIKGCEENE